MLAAIRRVISDSSDVGNANKKAKTMDSSDAPAPPRLAEDGRASSTGVEQMMTGASPASHFIESDHLKVDSAPLRMINPDQYASNSSLSDGSEHEEEDALVPQLTPSKIPEMTREQTIPRQIQRIDQNVLNRMDSAADGSSSGSQRASSQNSSRDWGWFEDVHQSTDGINPNEKRDKKMIRPVQTSDMSTPENAHGKAIFASCES